MKSDPARISLDNPIRVNYVYGMMTYTLTTRREESGLIAPLHVGDTYGLFAVGKHFGIQIPARVTATSKDGLTATMEYEPRDGFRVL